MDVGVFIHCMCAADNHHTPSQAHINIRTCSLKNVTPEDVQSIMCACGCVRMFEQVNMTFLSFHKHRKHKFFYVSDMGAACSDWEYLCGFLCINVCVCVCSWLRLWQRRMRQSRPCKGLVCFCVSDLRHRRGRQWQARSPTAHYLMTTRCLPANSHTKASGFCHPQEEKFSVFEYCSRWVMGWRAGWIDSDMTNLNNPEGLFVQFCAWIPSSVSDRKRTNQFAFTLL